MRTIRRTATIRELPDGRWLNKHTGRYYKDFTGAQRAIRKEAKAIVREAQEAVLIQTIHWETTTWAGNIIVRALAHNH